MQPLTFTLSFLLWGCSTGADLSDLDRFSAWFRDRGGLWGPGISPSLSESPCALISGAASYRVNADTRVPANTVRHLLSRARDGRLAPFSLTPLCPPSLRCCKHSRPLPLLPHSGSRPRPLRPAADPPARFSVRHVRRARAPRAASPRRACARACITLGTVHCDAPGHP